MICSYIYLFFFGSNLVRALFQADKPAKPPRAHCTRSLSKCPYCPKLDKFGTIKGLHDKRPHKTRVNISCESDNLVYAIECLKCGQHYVGQTQKMLRGRFVHHFSDIKGNNTKSLGVHFNSPGHNGLDDVKIYILEFFQTPATIAFRKRREDAERKLQYRLRSNFPLGMNRDDALSKDPRL